jgi:hypothetical protein
MDYSSIIALILQAFPLAEIIVVPSFYPTILPSILRGETIDPNGFKALEFFGLNVSS